MRENVTLARGWELALEHPRPGHVGGGERYERGRTMKLISLTQAEAMLREEYMPFISCCAFRAAYTVIDPAVLFTP